MTQSVDVIIVGGGHNGLTAGSYLAKAGVSTLVLEASPAVGGMTSTNPVLAGAPDHRINEGAMDASLIRTTQIVAELDLARHGLREIEVDPSYAYLGESGDSVCIWRDPHRTAAELQRRSPADARAFLELCNVLDALMNVAVPFMNANPTRPLTREIVRGALRTGRHPSRLFPLTRLMTASHAEIIDESFKDPAIRALLAALPCFAPMSDDGTGWVLVYFGLIQRAGVGRYVGGTGALTDALARCYADHGGQLRCEAIVEELVLSGNRVSGVRLQSGEELHARAVVTTCNVKSALTQLLPAGALPDHLAERAAHIPTSGTHASSFKIDLALDGRIDMSRFEEQRSDDVDLRKPVLCYTSFEEHVAAWNACARGVIPDPMPLLPVIPTGIDPSQAPEGKDTVWMWTGIGTAHPHEPWETQEDAVADREVARAAKYLGGIEDLVIDRQVMTPPKFEQRFRSPDGNVYHVDPTAMRFGPLRPAPGLAGYRTPVDGLFISGGGTHPSAGICGIPGKLAARATLRELRRVGWSQMPSNHGTNGGGRVTDAVARARSLAGSRS